MCYVFDTESKTNVYIYVDERVHGLLDYVDSSEGKDWVFRKVVFGGMSLDNAEMVELLVEMANYKFREKKVEVPTVKDIRDLKLPEGEYLRDLSLTQRAIVSLVIVETEGSSMVNAAKLLRVDRRLVSFVKKILNEGGILVLEALLEGNKVKLPGMTRPSKSLEVISKYVGTE